jgi:hypothetical protein
MIAASEPVIAVLTIILVIFLSFFRSTLPAEIIGQ